MEKASMTVAGEACPRFGLSTPGGPDAGAEYAAVTAAAGQAPAVELWFVDFTAPPPIGALEAVRTRGAEPIVTWEPWRALDDGEYDRSAYPMDEIAAGVHDDYLYRWADELRTWGGTVYLRFAHEPNGDWYPWSPAGGTGPETYVAAWQHIHDLFTLKQAHNVKWIWTVNVPHEGSSPIGPLYPGDDYVDVVGVDGYNWGTSQPWSRWQSPEEVFGPTLEEVADLAPGRPVAITEVASAGSMPTSAHHPSGNTGAKCGSSSSWLPLKGSVLRQSLAPRPWISAYTPLYTADLSVPDSNRDSLKVAPCTLEGT